MLIFDEIGKNGLIKNNVGKKFRQLMNKAQSVKIACPFISEQKERPILDELRGKNVQIVCNIKSPSCNPQVIRSILNMDGIDNTNVEIRYLDTLHAKVYIFDNEKAMSGSANYTPNGMGTGMVEQAVSVNEPKSVNKYLNWFENIWKKSKSLQFIDWDRLIAQWNENKKKGNKPNYYEKKVPLTELLQSNYDGKQINFAFWCEDDDGYGLIKERIARKESINQKKFDILTDSVLDENEKKDEKLINKLLKQEKELDRNFLIVFKTSPKRQLLCKKQMQIGMVFGFEYRKGNKISVRTQYDSIVTKYLLKPSTWFVVDYEFISLLDATIRERNEEWNKLLNKSFSYLSFSDMQKFLGYGN